MKITKNIILLAIVVISVAACSNSPESIKVEIQEHKDAIDELNDKIAALEVELVSLTPVDSTAANHLKIKVKELQHEKFTHYFEANGSLEAVNSAFISTEMNGQVKTIHVQEGQFVQEGQLLISLKADVIRNNIAELETGLELATTLYEKQKELWDQEIGSEVQFLQAKNRKESLEKRLAVLQSQLRMTQIYAPFAGIVDQIIPKKGELALPGVQLIQLVNLGDMYINLAVSENYLSKLSKGDAVMASFPSYPEKKINATIYRIGNIVNPENRTFQVRIRILDSSKDLKPNSLAIVRMTDYEEEQALMVPSLIVKNDLKGFFLFVAETENGQTVARKRYVTTGLSDQTNTMISEGLSPNERVITEGYNLVKEGKTVEIIN